MAPIRDWGAKLAGAVGRLAGLLHLAEHAGRSDPWTVPVSGVTMGHALELGRYFIPHAKRAYGAMGADPVVEHAKRVIDWLGKRANPETSWTERDCFNALRGTLATMDDLRPPLGLLERYGHITRAPREATEGPGRKPSPRYETNPYVLSPAPQNTHNTQNLSPLLVEEQR